MVNRKSCNITGVTYICHSALHIFADTKLPGLVRTKGYQGLGLFRYSLAMDKGPWKAPAADLSLVQG